jgi:hypothetical protein
MAVVAQSQGADAMSTTLRIAVLVGTHPPSRFARDMQQQRPSEAAVLAALSAQRTRTEAGRPSSPTRTHAGGGRSAARHASARLGAGTGRAHPRGQTLPTQITTLSPRTRPVPPSREIARTRVVGSLMSRRDGRQPSRLHAEGTARLEQRQHPACAGTRMEHQPRPRDNARCPRLRGRSGNAQPPQRFPSRTRAMLSSEH